MTDAFLRIHDLPLTERPRERLLSAGAEALKNSELIAILLRSGVRGSSAVQIAEELMLKYGSLTALGRVPLDELKTIKGIGRDKAIGLIAALALARRMVNEACSEPPLLDTPERVADLLREENRLYNVEQFQVVLLNSRRRLIRVEKVFQGTLDMVLVHPRDVFKLALLGSAAAIILVHNHPSGDPLPSDADIRITRKLIRAGQLLKIEVLDHIVLGHRTTNRSKDYSSLRELGHFP